MERDDPPESTSRHSTGTQPSSPARATPPRTLVLGRGKLLGIASPGKSTPGADRTPARRTTTTTNTNTKSKKPLHDDVKKNTQHEEEENEKEERQEKQKKKKKKKGREEEAEAEVEKKKAQETKKKRKREEAGEKKRSPPKGKRKGRHIPREEEEDEGSDDGELSREDSFDLSDFMEDLDSTMVEEEPHTTSTSASGQAPTEEDDFLFASAFAAAIEPKPVSSRLRPRRQGTTAAAPAPRPAVTSRKRRSSEGKWSVDKLLADLTENQDAEAEAETGDGYDEETLAFIQQETALRQQRAQGTSDKFDRQERRLDVFPHWPLKLPATEPPSALDPDVLLPTMIDEDTWPLFLGSGECLRFVRSTRDVPESFLRWLFHITALETANEHIVWAAGKALKATATKRAAARNLWVASIRDFEDVLRWYGAADVSSSAARLDTASASASAGAATVPHADDDSSSSEDQQQQQDLERFPVANLERVLDYMARAIRHRPAEYPDQDVVAMLRWTGVLLQDRRVGSRCYASLRACLCALFDHPVFLPADPLLQELELERVMAELLVTGHGGHVPNQAVVLSLLPTAASPRVLQLRKRMALALLEDHFGPTAATVAAGALLADDSVLAPAGTGGEAGAGAGGIEEGDAEARARDEASLDRMSAMLAGAEIGADTDYALLSCMIDFIDFAAIAMSGRVLRSEAGQRLTAALKALNARIREIHGFNLAITRVKDKLIILSGKLDQFKRLKGTSAPSPSLRSFLSCESPT